MVLEQLNEMLLNKNVVVLFFIGLTILAFLLISSRGGGYSGKDYYKIKRMRRHDIGKHITKLEKRTLEIDKEINKLGIKQQDLEIAFSTSRDHEIQKQLSKTRGKIIELANKRDKLLQEKELYGRAYREATI